MQQRHFPGFESKVYTVSSCWRGDSGLCFAETAFAGVGVTQMILFNPTPRDG